MGREKRKGRLNKTGENAASTGAFIGFGAFADPAAPSTPIERDESSKHGEHNGIGNRNNTPQTVRLSPIYAGSDPTLTLLFPKIGQKRDATTKSKALIDLTEVFRDDSIAKKTKAEALSHFLYLFQTKLYYDHSSKVRAHSVRLCFVASNECPKAWKNLVVGAHNEILGMILCSKADPAYEVRTAANGNTAVGEDGDIDSDQEAADAGLWSFAKKILSYNKPTDMHIDLFQKKGGVGDKTGKGASKQTPKLSEAQQEELEERYERIVGTTIEGLRLHLLQQKRDQQSKSNRSELSSGSKTVGDPTTVKYLWKTLASPKASLRRHSYALLSTVCQLSRTDLVDATKLSKLLPQSLSSEKESANVGPLLETLLAFVASCYERSERSAVMEQCFARPLSKIFKKGCHGAAPCSSWTPTILPLVALLPKKASSEGNAKDSILPPRIDLLTNIWEGRTHVVGAPDRCEVVRAVAETAAFLLAREESIDGNSDNGEGCGRDADLDDEAAFDQILAQCWIHALQSYLAGDGNERNKNGGVRTNHTSRAHRDLGMTLAKGWLQLDRASNWKDNNTDTDTKLPSVVYRLKEWFWDDALKNAILALPTKNAHLAQLLESIRIQQSKNQSSVESPLWAAQALGKKFQSLFPDNSQDWVASKDVYNLWIAILRIIPSCNQLFPSDKTDTLESFVMNRILSWTVIHTSHLSDQCNIELALLDMQLLHNLSVFTNAFRAWWGPIFREVLAAQPDLHVLTKCLGWLAREGKYCANDLAMKEEKVDGAAEMNFFFKFCIETAKTAVILKKTGEGIHHHDEDNNDVENEASNRTENEKYCKTKQFLRFCVGFDTQSTCNSEALVGETVVDAWVECACTSEEDATLEIQNSNPVLDTLVAMIRARKLSNEGKFSSVQRVLLQSWKQGDRLWENECLPWLFQAENACVRSSLIQNASTESKHFMEKISSTDFSTHGMNNDAAWMWTERANRLLSLCSDDDIESSIDLPSLDIVGIGDLSIWEEESRIDYLSTCLLGLIRHIRDVPSRWLLFVNAEVDTLELFVTVLIHLSQGSESPLQADLARRRQDHCAVLLAVLEFASSDSNLISDSIACCVAKLSSLLEESTVDQRKTCRSISVLSQLIEMRFVSVRPEPRSNLAREKLNPSDVQVGDKVWYITDATDPFTQEQCVLLKIHKDLPEEVYFTIQLSRNGEKQERQTLGERLRTGRSIKSDEVTSANKGMSVAVNDIENEEKRERERIVRPILDNVLNLVDVGEFDSYYEIYNILISQCGLIAGRGIGSAHYSVVQKLAEMQRRLLESLSSSDSTSAIASILWRLALALGFGMNTPTSEWSIPLIGLNAVDSISPLIEYEGDEENKSTKELGCAMAAWLSVCSSACEDANLRTKSFSLLFELATRLLCTSSSDENGWDPSHYIALRAIAVGQAESHKSKEGESVIQDSEAEALTELIKTFSMRWISTKDEKSISTGWESLSLFDSIMRASLTKRPSLIAIASRRCIDELAKALYDPTKQRYATLVIQAYAKAGQPLFVNTDDDDLINPATLERLETWVEDMLEDEADELEEDVATVAQWVCKEQMNDVESWHDDDDIDDEIACGRMLSWLSLLDIADAATGKDSLTRLAFTSYVSKCNAVEEVLDLALIYCNIGSDRKVELDIVVSMEEIIDSMPLSKLAARVIFRSVEVFPTLSKNWWDSSCPNYLAHTVREFVETQVSPDILNLAVESIKNAAAFGEMQVKGSSVTREVNATYVQDDFTLSVIIKLPLSFPFRRAEVDCSKTLGVPESRWKRWALQITQMLNNQGGTLKDALLLWKENVDKEFEGVEPCPVCYSVLHVKSHKLPNLECKTCHNQFHSECLFEWFKNSGKSACVICQQPWSGTRVQ